MIRQKSGTLRRLTTAETLFYLLFSIVLNSLANGLTVATNMGSAVWTASAVNLDGQITLSLGTILFLYAILVQALNILLRRRFIWTLVISNLLFAFFFSYLVQFWNRLFVSIGVNHLHFAWRIVIDIVGILGIATAVSVYQRVGVMMHPNDEFSYLLRFNFFNGNATKGQIVSYIIPVLIMLVCWLRSHTLLAVGVGTVVALLFQGSVTGFADKHIFARLRHKLTP